MSPGRWALALAAIGAIARSLIWLTYAPIRYGDTATYQRLAAALGQGGIAAYDATRVPGYPLFMLALESNPDAIRAAQMLLGWLATLLLFWLGWRATSSAAFGFALGMTYNVLAGQVLVESVLLSESLTTFLVVGSMALLVTVAQARRGVLGFSLLLGFTSAAAGLVRALFYILAPWYAFLLALPDTVNALPPLFSGAAQRDDRVRFRIIRLSIFAVFPVLLLGGWLFNVSGRYGMLSPSTMGGYHLVQHTGEYFHLLPDEHATLRDTYVKYRDERIAERGNQTNAIWDAIPELTEVTGLSFFDLSREMQRRSIQLILAHPELYAANAIEGWIDYWKSPVLWQAEGLRSDRLSGAYTAWALLSRIVTLGANAAFLALSLGAVVSRKMRQRIGADWIFAASAGLVWLASIVQTLVDHGDNPRFLVPLQILVFFVVMRAGYRFWRGNE